LAGSWRQPILPTDTTVIFLGDNGTPNEVTAKPYSSDHAKLRVYEQGVRVPMIVAGSGVVNSGRKLTGLVNTVDLYPTTCGSPASIRRPYSPGARSMASASCHSSTTAARPRSAHGPLRKSSCYGTRNRSTRFAKAATS
jgi:arylsulfatase A-like enzyme